MFFQNLDTRKDELVLVDLQDDYVFACIDPGGENDCEIMYLVSDEVDDTGYGFLFFSFGSNTVKIAMYDYVTTSIWVRMSGTEYFCSPNMRL